VTSAVRCDGWRDFDGDCYREYGADKEGPHDSGIGEKSAYVSTTLAEWATSLRQARRGAWVG
jgi:hypothetical protein